MSIDELLRYAPIILIGLGLLYLYSKFRNKEKAFDLPLETLGLVVEVGVFLFVIYLVDKFGFPDHNYFTTTILLFIPVWSAFIIYLLKGDDVYILVSSFQGDTFRDLDDLTIKASSETAQRLLIMSREVYQTKKHVGDLSYPFWRGSQRIHFADAYDDKKGTFYHHQDARLKNITFYIAKPFWLKLRDELPKIIRDNIILTWLSNYSLAHKQRVLSDRFKLHLKALERQHENEPFLLPDDINDLYEYLKDESARGLEITEQKMSESQDSKPRPQEVNP